jgi:hypothetical protein
MTRLSVVALLFAACGDDAAMPDAHADAPVDAYIPVDVAPVDANPPMFAGLVSVTADTGYSLRLAWTEATDAPNDPTTIQYRAYVGTAPGAENFATPASVTWGTPKGIVGGLQPNTDYYIVVRAADFYGNEETNTVERMAHTLAASPAVSLASDIEPVFNSVCAVSGCHLPPGEAEGMDFSTTQHTYNALVGVASDWRRPLLRVQAGDSGVSELVRKLLAIVPPFGEGDAMPPPQTGVPLLTDAQISLVREWIDQGAPNN